LIYLLHILFEAELKHLVCFIENDRLDLRKVNVSSLNMVKYSSSSADEDVHTPLECVDLVLDVHTSIDGQSVELLIVVLQVLEHSLYLEKKLVCLKTSEKYIPSLLPYVIPEFKLVELKT
jgi:hypothetical protein